MCVLIFSTKKYLILRRTERDTINYTGLHVKYPLLLTDSNETWVSSTDFWKMLKYRMSWKVVQWEPSCSTRTDGQIDMTKLTVALRNFMNAHNYFPKQYWPRTTFSVRHELNFDIKLRRRQSSKGWANDLRTFESVEFSHLIIFSNVFCSFLLDRHRWKRFTQKHAIFSKQLYLMTNLTHGYFLYMFISIHYMFRAFKCSSSGDSIVSIRYLV